MAKKKDEDLTLQESITKKPMGEFVMNAMTIYGSEVNNNRQFPNVYDGLKTVYRRVIYTMMKECGNSMTKTAKLGGAVLAYHPHGDASVNPVISTIVRAGMADGQGDHGMAAIIGKNFEPAAPRYTEAKLSKKFYEIFHDFMPYVPMVEGELQGVVEPKYLPTPIPLSLTIPSALGIGYGVRCDVPSFTVESMYNALMKDDPKELMAPFGLELDMEKSDLNSLWYKGKGKIIYKYKVRECDEDGNKGFIIYAKNAELVKPDMKEIDAACDNGLVWKNDISNEDEVAVLVCRCKGVKGFSDDDLKKMCEKAAVCKFSATLAVNNGERSFIIPLRNWLQITYTNYLKLIDSFKDDKINKLEFQYKVYDALLAVAALIMKNRAITEEEICKKLKLDLEVVQAIVAKPIKSLSSANGDEIEVKKKEITDSIAQYKALVPKDKTRDIIGKFTSGKLVKAVDIDIKTDDSKLKEFEKEDKINNSPEKIAKVAQDLKPEKKDPKLAKKELSEITPDGNVFSKAINAIYDSKTISSETRKTFISALEILFADAKAKDKTLTKCGWTKSNAYEILGK